MTDRRRDRPCRAGMTRLVMVRMVAVALTAMAAGGCSLDPLPLTIAVNSGVEGVGLKDVAYRFSTERAVPVEIVEFAYDALYREELAALSRPVSPFDVVMLDDPWLAPLLTAEGGHGPDSYLLDPLPPDAAEDANDLDDFFEACLTVCRYPRDGGALYALPFVGNTQLLVYNAGRHPAPPTEWDDVVRLHRAGVDASRAGDAYVMRVRGGNSIVTDFLPILWAASAPSADTASGSPRDAWTRALGHFRDLAEQGDGPNWSLVAADDFDLGIHLVQETASMSVIWSAWTMAMTAALADPAVESEDLVVAEVPGGQPTLGAWLLAVPRASAHKDLAHEFVRFATSPDMIARSIALGNPSPRQSHYGRDGVMAEAAGWFQCQRSSLELARPRPALPDWREVESRLGGVLSRLYTGRFDDAPDPVAAAVDEVEAAGLVELMSVETGRGDASTASPGRDSAGCSEPHRIGRRSER